MEFSFFTVPATATATAINGVTAAAVGSSNTSHNNTNWMTSTDSITRALENIQKLLRDTGGDSSHGSQVERRDTLMNGRHSALDAITTLEGLPVSNEISLLVDAGDIGRCAWWLGQGGAGKRQSGPWMRRLRDVVRIVEAKSPVAEVGADDEDVGRVGDVRG